MKYSFSIHDFCLEIFNIISQKFDTDTIFLYEYLCVTGINNPGRILVQQKH